MNKNRIIGMVVGAGLIVAVILISLGFNAAPEAQGSNPVAVGMGDLQRYEASALKVSSSSYVGMGDVQRFGAQKLPSASAAVGSSWAVSGGNAQLLEAQLLNLASGGALNSESAAIVEANLLRSGAQGSGSSYSGMGDLHKFESSQAAQEPQTNPQMLRRR